MRTIKYINCIQMLFKNCESAAVLTTHTIFKYKRSTIQYESYKKLNKKEDTNIINSGNAVQQNTLNLFQEFRGKK